ncbi:peptidase T [uncultured Sphaerochaeta sp.]|uniref:peptidase T n=1 Tax=uncultured Sphaerochaeta sp. TaxID=886478 RepID=UPI002A0A3F59|nr:peptidase T [uncultured Sphaerochaeta sp.]
MDLHSLDRDILQRFLRYVAVDTMSDSSSLSHPSTEGQWELLRLLEKELKEDLKIVDVQMHEKGILIARIPATCSCTAPVIALMAHVDTSSAVMGNQVKPRVIESYEGGDIRLNASCILTKKDNPELCLYTGQTLVVTDGTTLLGGDDKAGIAEILAVANLLVHDPSIIHGPIELYFTPDEEIDRGMNYFPYDKIACDWCYTVDGEKRDCIDTECFNAAAVQVTVKGISYHLGAGRGRMVNAVTIVGAMINALPQAESPEATDGRYGYYCPLKIGGTAEQAQLDIFLRDFDLQQLDRRIAAIQDLAKVLEAMYPGSSISLDTAYQYYNFAEESRKVPQAVKTLFKAGEQLGLDLKETVIRGGTDGSWMAQAHHVPCPNIFTGGYNRHSVYEWVALRAMEDSVRLMVRLLELAVE